ncbi:MAG TPA: hypothetical protein VJM53_03040 [Burkholderiales bacterium]|jgi:hypothetical protein|nr:hypothetical protein [Burkholderiales bacterium]
MRNRQHFLGWELVDLRRWRYAQLALPRILRGETFGNRPTWRHVWGETLAQRF